jgi:hypothetical protein
MYFVTGSAAAEESPNSHDNRVQYGSDPQHPPLQANHDQQVSEMLTMDKYQDLNPQELTHLTVIKLLRFALLYRQCRLKRSNKSPRRDLRGL